MSIFKTIFFVAYFCVLCLGQDLPGPTQHTVKPGYVYYPQINGYLKLHTEPADWLTAKGICHNEDASLTSPWTANITSAVFKLLSNIEQSSEEESNEEQHLSLVFFGSLENLSGSERLPDGVMTDLERCGVFYANGTTGHFNCKLSLPFICYALVTAPQPASTSTYTTPEYTTPEYTTLKSTFAPVPSCTGDGYELAKQTMSCYKFHVNGQTCTHAKATCMTEGASLAVINSVEETGVLAGLFHKNPDTSITNAYLADVKNNAYVGTYFKSGAWQLMNYEALVETGYGEWYVAGCPYQYQDRHPYGAIRRNNQYHLTHYGYSVAFICEKAPVYNSPNIY